MTLPIERYKEKYTNWRYNPFSAADMAVDATEDGLIIPAGSPFLIQLLELPRYNDPTTVLIRCYGVKTDVDDDSSSGQKILKVASTASFSEDDTIIIDRGGAREEERIIDTIQAGISLTVTVNLTYTHTAVQEDDVEKYIAFTETAGAPAQSQFRVDYPPDDGEGTGLVEFNQNDADKEVRIKYKATGSPILEEYLDTKLSYPAGNPADNQIVAFASGVPYWLQLPHANLASVSSDQHHAQAHSLASHSSKAHSELTGIGSGDHHTQVHTHASHTGIGANDHHPQAHTLASHSSKAHSELTGIGSGDHHAQVHTHASHSGIGANDHHAQTHTLGSHSDFSTYLNQAVKTTSAARFLSVEIGDANTKLLKGSSNALRVQTAYGYVDIGPRNTNYSHFDTDRASFVFNKAIIAPGLTLGSGVDGTITGGLSLLLEATAGTGTGVKSTTIYDSTTVTAANMVIGSIYKKLNRSTSALKYKDKVKDLELDPSLIHNLRPVSFNSLCKGDDKERRFIGLIADEIEKIYPEIINYNKNKEAESYDNQMLLTLVIKELQNLKQQLN